MGRPRPKLPGTLTAAAVSLGVATLLAGCTAASPAAAPRSGTSRSATARPRATQGPPAITVAGSRPVLPSGSQDTSAQAVAACVSATLAADKAVGTRVAAGFTATGLPVSADLLTHFLGGTGTEVDFRAGSAVSKEARASAAFQTVNAAVQAAVLSQLKAGGTAVRLPAAELPAVSFGSSGGDLYWGFRGTQGLTVTGSVRLKNGWYSGTLSYVIRDSYGFPADDTLGGFGPPMRYLQTDCGAPQHPGGAHWFPDAITVSVPFSHPA